MGARDSSFGTSVTNVARFYARDVKVDDRGFGGYDAAGRAERTQWWRDQEDGLPSWAGGGDSQDTMVFTRNEPVYVSLTSAIDPITYHARSYVIPIADVMTLTGEGISEEMCAGSVQASQAYTGVSREVDDPIALGYVGAWASGDSPDVARRYSPDAVLVDSLQSVRAVGPAAIGSLAARGVDAGGLPSATLHITGTPDDMWPDDSGYYKNGSGRRADRLVMLMDVADQAGCTRAVASVLWLDEQGLITREERLHRIDTLRECADDAALPSGWWEHTSLPKAPALTLTGTVPVSAEADIAVWNGEGLVPLVAWALRRYAEVGLPPPRASSVTFLPDVPGDPWATYGFLTGTDAPDIGVPVTRDSACSDQACRSWTASAKAAILHELAHVWVRATQYRGVPTSRAPGPRARAFLAAHNLVWRDSARPWEQQGSERAAETIAWGLMDEPYTVDPRMGSMTCAELAEDFEQLTFSTPDPRACAEPVPTAGGVR